MLMMKWFGASGGICVCHWCSKSARPMAITSSAVKPNDNATTWMMVAAGRRPIAARAKLRLAGSGPTRPRRIRSARSHTQAPPANSSAAAANPPAVTMAKRRSEASQINNPKNVAPATAYSAKVGSSGHAASSRRSALSGGTRRRRMTGARANPPTNTQLRPTLLERLQALTALHLRPQPLAKALDRWRISGHQHVVRDATGRLDQFGGRQVIEPNHHARRKGDELRAPVRLRCNDTGHPERGFPEADALARANVQRIEDLWIDPGRSGRRPA